jgi:NAD-dependent deacetylase
MLNLVILTGAGVSAESGVPTFRDSNGLWEGHRIEQVATPEGFAADPALVHEFYNLRRAALRHVEPNAAHLALADLEKTWRGEFLLVTQNVDDLHERGGSQKLIHMHGELLKARCESCGAVHEWLGETGLSSGCSVCECVGRIRPHIVWFGEVPFEMDRIFAALERADIFVSIGTSGQVYPAAGFVAAARGAGAQCIEINAGRTEISTAFHEHRLGAASVEVVKWVNQQMAEDATAGSSLDDS